VILGGDDTGTLIEPVPEEPPDAGHIVSRPGDLWLLGPHRLLCADTRDQTAVERLLDGQRARMVITDPPYNVPIDGHASGLGRHHHADFKKACGELSSEAFVEFLASTLGNLARVSMDGALHYVFMDWRHLGELLKAGQAFYSKQINLCIWAKTNGGMGSLYRSQHELIGVFKVGKAPHLNQVELGRSRPTGAHGYSALPAFRHHRSILMCPEYRGPTNSSHELSEQGPNANGDEADAGHSIKHPFADVVRNTGTDKYAQGRCCNQRKRRSGKYQPLIDSFVRSKQQCCQLRLVAEFGNKDRPKNGEKYFPFHNYGLQFVDASFQVLQVTC
jgi:hypothetical protein